MPREQALPIVPAGEISNQACDYNGLKAYAKDHAIPVKDLLVLAPQNDPFYAGAPTSLINGQWFAKVWNDLGFQRGVHIRRIHYAAASGPEPPTMPNGKPYTNTEECWLFLCAASKSARYLGLVDHEAFDDRKNPPPIIRRPEQEEVGRIWIGGWNNESFVLPRALEVPALHAPPLPTIQRYHLEVWCEKTTMNDVLVPLCERYGANLVTGAGELSTTAISKLLSRCQRDHPLRIFYVSDFDPAGQCMPVSAARKIEFFIRTSRKDLDVRLFPVALTAEQCAEYDLPRIPIKESERRKEGFEAIHGTGATELDALEAIHPGSLAEIVGNAMQVYYDDDLKEAISEAESELATAVQRINESVYARHREELDSVKKQYATIQKALAALQKDSAELFASITDELNNEDFPPVGLPEAALVEDDPWAVYDSRRSYTEQLEAYKAFQSGGTAI